MSKAILKSTAIVSVMTLVSRISGLVRDVVMANVLGSTGLADAFFVAFRIPNFLRRIFGEGAFAQAFIPVFSELTAQNTQDAKRFVNSTAGFLALITFVLATAGIVFAPALVGLYAPGYSVGSTQFTETVVMLRVMFPYLFCISLVAMSAGILNTLNRFAVPAVTPVILNVCMILAMFVLVPFFDNAARALACGVLIAGGVQLAFQIPSLLRDGYLPSFRIDKTNEPTRRVFRLMLPAIFSVSVAQINMLVNTWLASFLVTGSISWLYYSDRLMEFPVGVFGIALATVVLPSLSKVHDAGNAMEFSKMMDWALRWVTLIALPATMALFFLAVPLLSTIFQYNAFKSTDVEMAALALRAFSLGVCGFIFVKVLAPGFFARQDTQTPMRIAVVAVAVNILLSFSLVGHMQHTGLALAISIAAWVNSILLYVTLRMRGIYTPEPGWFWYLLRVFMAVGVMSFVISYLNEVDRVWFEWSLSERFFRLAILVGCGGVSYFVSLYLLGIRPKQLLLRQKAE